MTSEKERYRKVRVLSRPTLIRKLLAEGHTYSDSGSLNKSGELSLGLEMSSTLCGKLFYARKYDSVTGKDKWRQIQNTDTEDHYAWSYIIPKSWLAWDSRRRND